MQAWCKQCGGDEHNGRLCPPVKLKEEPVFEAPRRMNFVSTPSAADESWVRNAFERRQTVPVDHRACTCTTRFYDTPNCPVHDRRVMRYPDCTCYTYATCHIEAHVDQDKYRRWARERDEQLEWARNRRVVNAR